MRQGFSFRWISAAVITAVIAINFAWAGQATVAAASQLTFTPVADSYVYQSSPNSNYGSNTRLRTDASPIQKSYIRFNLSGVTGAKVTSAQLQLYASSSNPTGYRVRAVSDNSWGEMTITYANMPAMGTVIKTSGAVQSGNWVSVDVTSQVSRDGALSLGIDSTSSTATAYASRETGSTAPRLVVTVDSGTAAPTTTTPTPITRTSTRSSTPRTATSTWTATPTGSSVFTSTSTRTATATGTPTSSPTFTFTPSRSPTSSPAVTRSPTPTATPLPSLSFPIRAAFYYDWFPENWTQNGTYPYTNYQPTLGYYDSSSVDTIHNHITAMQYGGIQAGIISWWGINDNSNKRLPAILTATHQAGYDAFRWAIYYEAEGYGNPSISQIRSDLAYIQSNYASDPAYLRVGGRFVVFVYNADDTDCSVVDRWTQANSTIGAYLVMKVFPGYASCANQPSSWHQYGPAAREDSQAPYSFSISPGYWKYGESAKLSRDPAAFGTAVSDMIGSGSNWQLITTFNEWGEGTSVEDATAWNSSSGYGLYLDVLHNNGQGIPTPTPSPTIISTFTPTITQSPTPGGTETFTPTSTMTLTFTPSTSQTPTPAVLLSAGDIAKCDRNPTPGVVHQYTPAPNNAAYNTGAGIATEAARKGGSVITLGDNSNDVGSDWDYNNCFNPMWGAVKSLPGFRVSMGNHDMNAPTNDAAAYYRYFGTAAGPQGKGYYSLDLGSWHIVVLNAECALAGTGGCSPTSDQVKWLTSDLASTQQRCKLAVWHQPLFTTGTQNSTASMVNFWNVLYQYHADIILNGHNHNYERFIPQNPSGTPDPQGVVEFVVGTGGASHETSTTPTPVTEAIKNGGVYGFLELTLWPDHYDWKFIPTDGSSFADQGSAACH